ncbi:MAG: surface carbohydrate biosynthesis protein [Planctomycetota bacterium]
MTSSPSRPLLLLPVENQVRELDAKLLVATMAALEGYSSVIGWKGYIDYQIARFGPSIYFAKSISPANTKMLGIKRQLGHFVIAWDEEAVVHYPAEIYYRRRVGQEALQLIDRYVCWGEDNDELMRGHPGFDPKLSRILGNPRIDLLRPELREFFRERAETLRSEHGDFVLVNTNFGSVNGYTDKLNLMRQDESGTWTMGRGSKGMPLDYAQGLFAFRSRVLEGFREILPRLAAAKPQRRIILRPHPSEDHEDWRRRLADHPNIEVIAQGNVVPWLMACSALLHNGCTTAVEGFVLGTKIVSFVPEDDDRYEFALPNALGPRCRNIEEVLAALAGSAESSEVLANRRSLATRFIGSLDGELSSQRIVAMLDECHPRRELSGLATRTWGKMRAEWRQLNKIFKQRFGVARYGEDFRRQRFPELSEEFVQQKVDQFATALSLPTSPRVRQRSLDLFQLTPRSNP